MSKKLLLATGVIVFFLVGALVVFQRQKPTVTQSNDTVMETMPGEILVRGFNYGYSPKTISVKQGEMVMLKLVSDDSPHTFTIDELGVNEQFTYGKDTSVMFTPTQKGTFQFYCAAPDHREGGMVGTLIVE